MGSLRMAAAWLLGVLATLAIGGAVRADAVGDFYKGKTITMIVGPAPGVIA